MDDVNPVQPPPDLPPPLPGREAKRSWFLAGGMIVGMLAVLAYGWKEVRRQRLEARRDAMFGQVRSLAIALLEFDAEYGSYPDERTLEDLCAAIQEKPWRLENSNDFLRQLIAAGLKSEKLFSDDGAAGWTRRPDEVSAPLSKVLEAGECAFAYVPGDTTSRAGRPLLLYPVLPGGRTFDPKPLGGRALILRVDGSVGMLAIGKDRRVMMGGKDLFDPSQPFWGGSAPVVYEPAR